MNRRDFLSAGLALSSSLIVPGTAIAGDDDYFWSLPRRLRIKRAQTGEYLDTVYWADGAYVPDGYSKLCWILRDTRQNVSAYMDPRLFDVMRAVQSHVEYYGYKAPLLVNSGYRTQRTNDSIEGAAKNSLHMKGRAVDFVMPGLPSVYMGTLASHYKAGGVGFYPDNGFTHMDTGNVRYWLKKKGWNIRPSRS